MKVLLFVDINFRGLQTNRWFVGFLIRGLTFPTVQINGKYVFRRVLNFVVLVNHEIHENWYPTNNSTFTVNHVSG